ncbi:MAG: 50S ribosomal protein L29 [Cyanobacteria bacterium P01_D01_bin.128]
MALSKIQDIRQLSDQDIADEIVKVKKELFDLRFRQTTRQMEGGPHQFKHGRHRLAQLKTVQQERLGAQDSDAALASASPADLASVENQE